MGDDVAGDFRLLLESRGGELQQLWVLEASQGLVGELLRVADGGLGGGELLGRGEEELGVFGAGDGPLVLRTPGERSLLCRVVEADVALAEDDVDLGHLAGRPAVLVFALEPGVQEGLLHGHLLAVVEGQVVTSRDGTKPLLLRAGPGEAFDVPAEVEVDAAPVGDGERGDLDVAHVVLLAGVVVVVAEEVVGVVDVLVPSVLRQLLRREITLDGVDAPVGGRSSGLAILIRDDLPIPPEFDEAVG